jgi:methionyl-tRNA synthetase
VNRAVVLTQKYFGGKVPRNLKPEAIDAETLGRIPECRRNLEGCLDTFHFREALKEVMNIARIGNKYISDTEPWKVAKTDMDRCASILYTSLQICANLAIAFEPFTPFSAAKLRDILKVGVSAGSDYRAGEGVPTENFYTASEGSAIHTLASDGREEPVQSGLREHFLAPVDGLPGDIVLTWENLGERELLPAGHELGETVLLFAKIEDSVVEAQIAKLHATKAANESSGAQERAYTVKPQKEMCTYDDFEKLDIRTATVLEAERVPNTDKLLKLTIETGIDRRTIVSGIAESYTPEQMLGKQICILANLQPRVIRGIESKGMILMAEQPDGKMRFITPQEVLADGSQIS